MDLRGSLPGFRRSGACPYVCGTIVSNNEKIMRVYTPYFLLIKSFLRLLLVETVYVVSTVFCGNKRMIFVAGYLEKIRKICFLSLSFCCDAETKPCANSFIVRVY